jgi:hypothetical protein
MSLTFFTDISPVTIPSATATTEGVVKDVTGGGTFTNPTLINPTVVGYLQLASFSDATRPVANTIPMGGLIFNTDDRAPNISDGTVWRDMDGEQT